MSIKNETEDCGIVFTEFGLKLSGKCAEGFESSFGIQRDESKSMGLEQSAYLCANGTTGEIEDVTIGAIGTPTSTTLPIGRVCRPDQIQIPVHTHPTSGEAKFSDIDAITTARRINEGIDDGHCVIGDNATLCLFKVVVKDTKD